MMASKARVFGDGTSLEAILATTDPREAKALGRAVLGFDDEVWRAASYAIVLEGNLAKFSQNAELAEFLGRTGRRVLVEASPADRIWGVGMAASDPDLHHPLRWRGTNWLGLAWLGAHGCPREAR